MKEQQINERQSLDIITAMIAQTKERLHMGDGNILLLWGYLTVSVSILVGVLLYITHSPACNWLWFLIPAIGCPATTVIARRQQVKVGAKTYTDRLCSGIWTLVGWCSFVSILICFGFMLFAAKSVWSIMLVYALLVVGLIVVVQGLIIREKSMVFGGSVGMIAGCITLACVVAQIPLALVWFMPMFILTWICMMIIPGHCLNDKAKNSK